MQASIHRPLTGNRQFNVNGITSSRLIRGRSTLRTRALMGGLGAPSSPAASSKPATSDKTPAANAKAAPAPAAAAAGTLNVDPLDWVPATIREEYERFSYRATEVDLPRKERIADLAKRHNIDIELFTRLNPWVWDLVKPGTPAKALEGVRVEGVVYMPGVGSRILPAPEIGIPTMFAVAATVVLAALAKGLESGTALLYRLMTGSGRIGSAADERKIDQGPSDAEVARVVWKLMLPDILLVIGCVFTLVFCAVGFLMVPVSIGQVFDVLQETAATTPETAEILKGRFIRAVATLGAALGGAAVANAVQVYISTIVGERFSVRVRRQLFAEILRRDQSYFDRASKGELLARLTSDIAVLQTVLVDVLGNRGVRALIEVTGSIMVSLYLNPKLSAISLITVPILSLLTRMVVVKSAALAKQQQAEAAEALRLANERLSGIRTVRVFGQEASELAAYEKRLDAAVEVANRAAILQGLSEAAGRLSVNIGTAVLLGVGGYLVLQGQLSLGALLSFNVFNLYITLGLGTLAAAFGDVGRAMGAIRRVIEAMQPPPGSANLTLQGTPPLRRTASDIASGAAPPSLTTDALGLSVELRDVRFAYRGRPQPALDGVSLYIPAGTSVAFVGLSGSGKSTVGALLMRLYEPDEGAILVDGVDLRDLEVEGLRRQVSLVQQEPSAFLGTIRDNIRAGRPDATDAEVEEAACAAGAHIFINQLPDRYDTMLGERGASISGGQRQRLAIARAVLRKPKILILDEATSALDVETEAAVTEALQQHLKGTTVIIIAHRLSTVRAADQIVVMDQGQTVEQGNHEELMSDSASKYRSMVMASERGEDPLAAPSASASNGAAPPPLVLNGAARGGSIASAAVAAVTKVAVALGAVPVEPAVGAAARRERLERERVPSPEPEMSDHARAMMELEAQLAGEAEAQAAAHAASAAAGDGIGAVQNPEAHGTAHALNDRSGHGHVEAGADHAAHAAHASHASHEHDQRQDEPEGRPMAAAGVGGLGSDSEGSDADAAAEPAGGFLGKLRGMFKGPTGVPGGQR